MRWVMRQWPVLIWAAVIFTFSTHWFGNGVNSAILLPVLRFVFPRASAAFLAHALHFTRKGGHVTEYFIFSLLLIRAIRNGRPGWRLQWALLAILIVFVYAGTDEWHQSFVPGRGPAFSDVILDTTAGTIAQILAALWLTRKRQSERTAE